MNTHPIVDCRAVTKRFYFDEHRPVSLREWFIRTVLRKNFKIRHTGFAFRDVTLQVFPGEIVALVGSNGSGKSSMLRLIAGIYHPSEGTIVTRGRIAPIIELGAGFHKELTGAENIALYAAVLGLSARDLAESYEEILDFSGMAEHLDTPLKYLSSGMEARLAFSVAVCVHPDLLLLDEILAVGDHEFRQRCFDRLRAYNNEGGTIILVSHDYSQIQKFCSRVIWLERGAIRLDGETAKVLEALENAPRDKSDCGDLVPGHGAA